MSSPNLDHENDKLSVKYDSGPLLKKQNSKSIITKVLNMNNFPVNFNVSINILDKEVVEPHYVSQKQVYSKSSSSIDIIDISNRNFLCFNITFDFFSEEYPIKDHVYIMAIGRSDKPTEPAENSHLISDLTLKTSDFCKELTSKSDYMDEANEDFSPMFDLGRLFYE
ncbi:hypothetical protein [Natranaerobius thermophilus]|uniref:Uncharacterized protein n=1 Tax=Natranaerobius thermophilus (strain ATCC BAA-1301 / DSM 18059 / JW/NM-WN-LF) TaxID=457570 RepID=B2A4V1_NATTJ|nr:hypothetical protein [Natranaerobius thermophilus]ACB83873.1 hypothetical protein Nther_0275 [Natranaerobius thermophilus JW/NM-WN-LF]